MMSRQGKLAIAVTLYIVAAALTFNFAHPFACGPLKWEDDSLQRAYWNACLIDNMKSSAIDAIAWPIYWTERLVS